MTPRYKDMNSHKFPDRIFLNMLTHIDSIAEKGICNKYLTSMLADIKVTGNLSGTVKVPLPTKLPMESLDVCNYTFRNSGLDIIKADYKEGKNIKPDGDTRMRLVKVNYEVTGK